MASNQRRATSRAVLRHRPPSFDVPVSWPDIGAGCARFVAMTFGETETFCYLSRRSSPRDRVDSHLKCLRAASRSEEHTSELQSLMRISYAVFCLKKTKYIH